VAVGVFQSEVLASIRLHARDAVSAPEEVSQFNQRLAELASLILSALHTLEMVWRHLGPARLAEIRERLTRLHAQLIPATEAFRSTPAPDGLAELSEALLQGADALSEATGLIADPAGQDPIPGIMRAMHLSARAHEPLYPLRGVIPPLGRYFSEPAWHDRVDELDRDPPEGVSVGIHRAGSEDRGGFCLYIPERYDASRALPLVVALHGGSGHGHDFLWSWLREARSREVFLLSPTSLGSTWSLDAPERDMESLLRMVDFVKERWRVDDEHILLTGLSDGATFTTLAGLADAAPYTALAPISGVFHPFNFVNGNLDRARGRRIYLVHGALDWMFPVTLAQNARDALQEAGADLVYREIADLAHAYPREENARILRWLDPRLALPGDSTIEAGEAPD
jgi:phospholipase/carboxylesterase